MTKLLCCLMAGALATPAQGPQAPSPGYTRTSDGRLARIFGIPGSLTVERASDERVDALAFSGRLLVSRRGGWVRIADANGALLNETEVPEGSALFGFSREGDRVVAYYPREPEFRVYAHGEWRSLRLDARALGGEVIAIALTAPGCVSLVVAGEGLAMVRARIADGAIEARAELSDAAGPAALLPSGAVLYARNGSAMLRDASGEERDVALPPGVARFQAAGPGWVEAVMEGGPRFLVRVEPDLRVSELPEVEP